nr:S-layer homology domain-containing protein [uncultured Cellulosilyticum sp.]
MNEYAKKGNFNDISQAAYYANYLAYAKGKRLTKGRGENKFLTNDNKSRQDMR